MKGTSLKSDTCLAQSLYGPCRAGLAGLPNSFVVGHHE